MKTWIVAVLIFAAGKVHAGGGIGVFKQACYQQAVGTSTVPTELTGNLGTNTPQSIWSVKVTNIDTSFDLFCSSTSSVSTTGSNRGDEVAHASAAPWNWMSWIINPNQGWYCITSNTAATTNALVCLTN